MESFLSRYRNSIVLVALVFGQVIALATQVKRTDPLKPNGDKARLLRVWVIEVIAPPERFFVHLGEGTRSIWRSYVALNKTNQRNEELQGEVNRFRAERVRLYQDAMRTQQLEKLLGFKEQYVSKTVAAQVIGSSGTDSSHVIYIDKGERDGLKTELPVITPDGIVGKVKEVYSTSAQVLLLNDQQSGIGVMLEKSRRQGIMKGSLSGQLEIHYVMADEKIEPGDKVYSSGGDRIFPKGLEVGAVTGVVADKDRDGFQLIRVKPNANLFRLEEVLVVTQVDERTPAEEQQASAAEMLSSRLPGIDLKAVEAEPKTTTTGTVITPPPVRPARALAPDRFSPPGEVMRGANAAEVTTKKPAVTSNRPHLLRNPESTVAAQTGQTRPNLTEPVAAPPVVAPPAETSSTPAVANPQEH